ncbi:hypothetical protein C8D88_116121 [Lentzea atacamensis]|uniref:Uncharacterized protein n=1 Tax=Lentzea atacamensis TaxID=531938 RepID=A0A316I2R6_9PSEU|nr:hypothetical protein C8D88_116121 [Lentzea atacamensis]
MRKQHTPTLTDKLWGLVCWVTEHRPDQTRRKCIRCAENLTRRS